MILKNAITFLPDSTLKKADVTLQNNSILSVSVNSLSSEMPSNETTLDLEGCYLFPGFIDTHLHGAMGMDFSDGTLEAIKTMANYELTHGITSFLPATMTLSEEQLLQICQTSAQYLQNGENDTFRHSTFLGIHMEGPFFSKEKCGAQNPAYLQHPNTALFAKLWDASAGQIRICSLAPELTGVEAFLEEVSIHSAWKNATFAIGHTTAKEPEASMALQNGVTRITHFYNGMAHFSAIEKAVLTSKNCFVELICDGCHNSPDRILHAFDVFGPERMILISDSMRATGMPDGLYTLGGQEVIVSGRDAMLSNGTRAGSVCNLFDCFLTCTQLGIPLVQAIRAVTLNPAKSLHLDHSIGSIAPGLQADLLILNQKLELLHVIKNGQII